VASDKHSGHPPSSRNDEVLAEVLDLVREGQRLTIKEVAEEVGISFASCQSILTKDLGLRRVSKVCSAAADSGAEGALPL
jgi:transposase